MLESDYRIIPCTAVNQSQQAWIQFTIIRDVSHTHVPREQKTHSAFQVCITKWISTTNQDVRDSNSYPPPHTPYWVRHLRGVSLELRFVSIPESNFQVSVSVLCWGCSMGGEELDIYIHTNPNLDPALCRARQKSWICVACMGCRIQSGVKECVMFVPNLKGWKCVMLFGTTHIGIIEAVLALYFIQPGKGYVQNRKSLRVNKSLWQGVFEANHPFLPPYNANII